VLHQEYGLNCPDMNAVAFDAAAMLDNFAISNDVAAHVGILQDVAISSISVVE
jgi:hypothetical protein